MTSSKTIAPLRLSRRASILADLVACHGLAYHPPYRALLAHHIALAWRACTPRERLHAFAVAAP